jgi:hypothetical protein
LTQLKSKRLFEGFVFIAWLSHFHHHLSKTRGSAAVIGRVKTSHSWARSKPAGERKIS